MATPPITQPGGEGVFLANCYNYHIENVHVRNSVIKRNKVHHNSGDGIHLSQGKGNRNNLVCDNDVHHNGGHGIALTGQYCPGESRCSISNNRIWNNRSAGILISGSARRNTVTGNCCYDDRDADADRQRYGILVDSTRNTVVDNRVHGNAKQGIKAGYDSLDSLC